MIERGKSADQLEKGKVNKRLAKAIAQDKGNSQSQNFELSFFRFCGWAAGNSDYLVAGLEEIHI